MPQSFSDSSACAERGKGPENAALWEETPWSGTGARAGGEAGPLGKEKERKESCWGGGRSSGAKGRPRESGQKARGGQAGLGKAVLHFILREVGSTGVGF